MQSHVEHQLIVEPIRLSPELLIVYWRTSAALVGRMWPSAQPRKARVRAHTAFSSGVLALNSARCLKWNAMSVPRIIEMICEPQHRLCAPPPQERLGAAPAQVQSARVPQRTAAGRAFARTSRCWSSGSVARTLQSASCMIVNSSAECIDSSTDLSLYRIASGACAVRAVLADRR